MDTILEIAPIVSATAAIIALCITVAVYRHSLKREVRIETLKKLSEIRGKYCNTENMDTHEKQRYLQELEFLSVGVNEKLYDIDIVSKMSGKRLLKQYDKWMRAYIEGKKEDSAYCELKKVMDQLRKKKGKKEEERQKKEEEQKKEEDK